MSIEHLDMGIRLGYKDLNMPNALSIKYVQKQLKNIPLHQILVRLSAINLIFSNARDKTDIDLKIREKLLDSPYLARIKNHEITRATTIFNRQAILLLIHLARHYCELNIPSIEGSQLDKKIGTYVLIINDFLSDVDDIQTKDGDREFNSRSLAPPTTRQHLFNHTSQARYAIPQSWLIYEGLKNKARSFIDISNLISQKREFTLNDYFKTLIVIYLYWSRQTIDNWDPSFLFINLKNIFSKLTNPPNSYLSIINLLSIPAKPKKNKLPSFSDKKGWRKEIYEQFDSRLRPLLKLENAYICYDIEFVKNSFWDGPYHMILTDYPKSPEVEKMTQFLGDTTEHFVRSIGKDAFGDKFIEIKTAIGNPMGDGVIKLTDNWLVIIECKAARPGIEMLSGDKPITELSDFNRLILKGLTQLSKRIQEYIEKNGYSGRITPILITAGAIPQNEFIWELILEKTSNLIFFKNNFCDFPFVMDLEGWNVICSAKKAGIELEEILTSRYKDHPTRTSNTNNFLFKTIFKKAKREEPAHEDLLSLFEDRVDEITKELFNNSYTNRKTTPNTWKTIFDL